MTRKWERAKRERAKWGRPRLSGVLHVPHQEVRRDAHVRHPRRRAERRSARAARRKRGDGGADRRHAICAGKWAWLPVSESGRTEYPRFERLLP